jgi:hypothetical protein
LKRFSKHVQKTGARDRALLLKLAAEMALRKSPVGLWLAERIYNPAVLVSAKAEQSHEKDDFDSRERRLE